MKSTKIDIKAFCLGEGLNYKSNKVEIGFNIPWRRDQIASGSFNIKKGIWYDHGTGEGGDTIKFIAKKYQYSRIESRKYIREKYADSNSRGAKNNSDRKKKAKEWKPLSSIPQNIKFPTPRLKGIAHKHFTDVYYYKNISGKFMGVVCRWDPPSGKKCFPYSYCEEIETKKRSWKMQGLDLKYPLYGIENFKTNNKPILIVEGERCAVFAQNILGEHFLVLTWHGGTNRVDGTDWTPLINIDRPVSLWPDNDDSGIKVMKKIANKINGSNVKILSPPTAKPKKWDVADAIEKNGWTKRKILRFLSKSSIQNIKPNLLSSIKEPKTGELILTDTTVAKAVKNLYGEGIKFNNQNRRWYLWNGKRFVPDTVDEIYDKVKETNNNMYNEILEYSKSYSEPRVILDIAKKFLKYQNANHIRDVLRLLGTEDGIRTKSADFDQNNYLFNLNNGTYDLKNHSFESHDIKNNITKISNFNFEEKARCPFWEKSLKLIFGNDKAIISFFQKFIGYSLTGLIDEQCLLFFYGMGKNGKSTLIASLEMIFGEYFCKVPADMLSLAKGNSGIPLDVARLDGARLAVCDEVQQDVRLNEARVKNLTGGDTVTARFLYKNLFTFEPTHKLIMYGNHKPKIKGTDKGIWRRIVLIPFEVEIPSSEQLSFSKVKQNIKSELPGIFNWALQGFKKYKKFGLNVPDSIQAASKEYQLESNIVGNFIQVRCEKSSAGKIQCLNLYDEYKAWCRQNERHPESYPKFNSTMKELGYNNKAGSGNLHYWIGLVFAKIKRVKKVK